MDSTSNHEDAAAKEVREIRKLIRNIAEEEGFPSFDVISGEDSTAVPAAFISFFVRSADAPTSDEVKAVKRLRRRVESVLFEHGIKLIPYIRFRKTPEHAG